MGRVVVYSDYVCPFCYLAWPAVRSLLEEGGDVVLRPFELRPAPAPLPRALTAGQREAWDAVIAPRAAALGLPAQLPGRFPRTRKAHEAVQYARTQGVESALHDALFRAYFAEGRDIGRIDVLVGIGESVGLDRTGLKVELDIDQYTGAVLEQQRAAAAAGVTAVPAYVEEGGAGGQPRVHMGLLSESELRRWLAQDHGEPRERT